MPKLQFLCLTVQLSEPDKYGEWDEYDKICDSGETCRVEHKQSGKFKVVKLQESKLFKNSR